MEKRINSKIYNYIQTFKDDFKEKLSNSNIEQDKLYEVLQYLYQYEHLMIDKNDLQKRKRVKNIVPFCDRCKAKRANGEQCSRRKKDESEFCGTHIKGIPHGEINETTEKPSHSKKVVRAQDIKGIIYYIDDDGNVYEPHDVMNNVIDPKIIAKYLEKDGEYSIPSLF